MKLLNEEQATQLEKQIAAHNTDQDIHMDMEIASDLVLKDFVVKPGILRPDITTSIHFARWLYEQRDLYEGRAQKKQFVDIGCGSGVQGIPGICLLDS